MRINNKGKSNKYYKKIGMLILLFVIVYGNISIFCGVLKNQSDYSDSDSEIDYLKTSIGETTELEGAGTAAEPYLIKTVDNLKCIDSVNSSSSGGDAYYKLANNITINDSDWTPICNSNAFKGTFDGNNKTITFSSNQGGLLGKTASGSTIKNLKVNGSITKDVISASNDSFLNNLGTIVANNQGNIENCEVTGEINISSTNGTKYTSSAIIGGIVGTNTNLIKNCNSSVQINCNYLARCYIGGIAGKNESSGSIISCSYKPRNNESQSNNIVISGNSDELCIGGVVGYNNSENAIINVMANVKISLSSIILTTDKTFSTDYAVNSIGGLIGNNNKGTLYNSFSIGNIIIDNDSTITTYLSLGQVEGYLNTSNNKYEIVNCYSRLNFDISPNIQCKITNNGEFTLVSYGFIARISNNNRSDVVKKCYSSSSMKNCHYHIISGTYIAQTTYTVESPTTDESFIATLNENRADNEDWATWIPDDTNNGYPTLNLSPAEVKPIFDESDNSLYANRNSIIINKDEGNDNTVVYWDKNDNQTIDQEDEKIEIPTNGIINNVFGGFKDSSNSNSDITSYITMLDGSVTNIYGGSFDRDFDGKTTIIIKGGTIDYITANSANNYSTTGTTSIQLSGTPTIGSPNPDEGKGIDLDSFTDKKINIIGSMQGDDNSINLFTSNKSHGKAIISLDSMVNSDNFNGCKLFNINNLDASETYKILYQDVNIIKIIDAFSATLNGTNVNAETVNNTNLDPSNSSYGIGFGAHVAIKDNGWIGKISAPTNYKLPDVITVTMNGNPLVADTDYTWDKSTGIITITNVTGDVVVSADAIYVPPITYVDKPSIAHATLTYTGKSQQPTIALNSKYSVSISPATNAGKYTATVSLKNKALTKWSDGTTSDLHYTWTIKKAPLQIIAHNKNITYGDVPTSNGVNYAGFVGNDTVSSLGGKLSYTYNYARYGNVGNYSIIPQGYTSNNYDITYTPGVLSVSPKKISFVWNTPSEFKYDGKSKQVTATIIGIVNNDDVHISSYTQNSANQVGRYNATIKGLSGSKSNNYTLSGVSNLSKEWLITKADDVSKEDTTKEDTAKEDTTKKNNDNTNPNNGSNSTNNINPYFDNDVSGAVEGTRTNAHEFVAKLDDGTIVKVNGNFSSSIKLMVKSISSKEKVWEWIKNITEDIGINKEAFDIFFVNNSGNKVNTGAGTKISILSSDRKQDIEVYYIDSAGGKQKLRSNKEEYTVQFNMVENGYYTLLTSDQSLQLEKSQDGNITNNKNYSDSDNIPNNSSPIYNTDSDNNIKSNDLNNNKNENKSIAKNNLTKSDVSNTMKTGEASIESKESYASKDNNIFITVAIILIILTTLVLFIIILKKQKNDNYDIASI